MRAGNPHTPSVGRPTARWTDDLRKVASCVCGWMRAARDRRNWRAQCEASNRCVLADTMMMIPNIGTEKKHYIKIHRRRIENFSFEQRLKTSLFQ